MNVKIECDEKCGFQRLERKKETATTRTRAIFHVHVHTIDLMVAKDIVGDNAYFLALKILYVFITIYKNLIVTRTIRQNKPIEMNVR